MRSWKTCLAAMGVCLATPGALTAQQPPPPASGEAAARPAEAANKAPKEVRIKEECGTLESVFRRRTALHYLKSEAEAKDAILKDIDPESAAQVRRLIDTDSTFKELDYHYLEKLRNCEQRILNRMRLDKFNGIEDLLEVVKDKKFPISAAYANLMNTVEMNFRFALRRGLISDSEFGNDVAGRLATEVARVTGTAGHSIVELAKEVWKDTKPDGFPVHWFDQSSGSISYTFEEVPPVNDFPKVDLNKATRDELLSLPNVESEIADGILKYREKNGFEGPEELRLVRELPDHLSVPLQSLCIASHQQRTKKWTVMVYLNAANNLEPFGIEDMNEMEKVGSTADVNIVVECARFHGNPKPRPNSSYFFNPYAEFENVYYFGLDNEPGTRRYYIVKDDDPVRVRSVLKMNVGETDAGRPEPLASFGQWAVTNYPAEHYALVIWNHGAGWSGVSADDNTKHTLDLPEVRTALEGITAALQKQGKNKIDVLDFDACLMATVEVAYELHDTVDYLASSQETEPGDGMPYDDYLAWLDTYPEASPLSLAKSMVGTYVKSYAPEGSQIDKDGGFYGAETKSAIRMTRVAELRDAIEDVAAVLEGKTDLLGEVAEEIIADTRAFGRLVDIQDFLHKVCEHEKADPQLKAACKRVTDLIAYPNDGEDTLVNEVVIKRRDQGSIIWGWNGWLSPPRNLAPFVHESRHAKTPLVGPDEKGNYVAKIKFPPMLMNPKTKKLEFVKEINYRFEDESEKRTMKDFQNTFITTDFPDTSVVCAEGHLVGNNRSHGISLYFPAYLGFNKEYRKLRFAQKSRWADLCEKFPLKKIDHPAGVALLGINHATKAARAELGKVVVREQFDKLLRRYDFAASYRADLKKLELAFDAIKDSRPYGEDWLGLISSWQHGIVILDNHDGAAPASGFEYGMRAAAPRIGGPDGRTVMRFLESGGHLLMSDPRAAAALWDTPLYRDTLGIAYEGTWDYSYAFQLAGGDAGKVFEIDCARKGESIVTFTGAPGVEPFATLKDGGRMIAAKIARQDAKTGTPFKAVVLGFYLSDIKGDDDRLAVFKAALDFLKREPTAEPSPSPGISTTASTNAR
ncbi:MAG: clostripain-related cysteine peptidase [Planctomycetota bacterium]